MSSPAGAWWRALVLLLATLLLTACGVRPQDRPEPVTTAAAPSSNTGNSSTAAGPRLIIFFVRDAELAQVERRTHAATTAAALEQLVEGPTRAEVGAGLRTALPPEVVGVDEMLPGGLTTVSVTRGFTGITGGDQLLAVAQIVWTLTDLPTVTAVRFAVDGTPVEVPTDAGLSNRPVDRGEYESVSPPEPTPAPDDVSPTGAPTPR